MGMYDRISGQLTCPVCNAYHTDLADIQIKIRESPDLKTFRVGDKLDNPSPLEDCGFYRLRVPDNEEIQIMLTWDCSTCGAAFNWAKLTLRNWTIIGLTSVLLNHNSLNSTHYICDDIDHFRDELSIEDNNRLGANPWDLTKKPKPSQY